VATSCVDLETGEGLLEVSLSGLLEGIDYTVSVYDAGDVLVDSRMFAGSEGQVDTSWNLPPGDYTVVVTWSVGGEERELLAQDITIEECPADPGIEIVATSCVDEEIGDGLLEVTLTGLVEGIDYTVSVYDANDDLVDERTFAGSEGEVDTSWDLPPGDYTAVVTWSMGEMEMELLAQDITIEECPDVPELMVMAEGTGCSLGDDGTALVSLAGLVEGEDYDWTLNGDGDFFLEGTLEDVDGGTLDVPFGDLPPGNYEFYIESAEDDSVFASATFFVEPCPPEITVVVHECPAYGEDGSATLSLSDLVEGVDYAVWVTAKGDIDGTIYGGIKTVVGGASHMDEVLISPLPAGMQYTAWVYAVWTPPGGSSEWGEVDEFELSTSVDFSLKACPDKPHKPEKPEKPGKHVTPAKPSGLAKTGTDGTDGMLAAALLMLGLGGAALTARRIRVGSRTE